MRRVAMQLTLAFLEPPPPTPPPSRQLRDAQARAEALSVLARIIAQACQTTDQTEATNE
jgi:hypothetical protein